MAFIGRELTRNKWLFIAKMAENSGRHKEAAHHMRMLVNSTQDILLTNEELNLLSSSHHNVVEPLRDTYRYYSQLMQRQETSERLTFPVWQEYHMIVQEYLMIVRNELANECEGVIQIIRDVLVVHPDLPVTTRVLYWRMIGDYYCNLVQIRFDAEREDVIDQAISSYERASNFAADAQLALYHPEKLALALNMSLFFFNILGQHDLAFHIAKEAFEAGAKYLKRRFGEGPYPEDHITILMKNLRDNIIAWESVERDDRAWHADFFSAAGDAQRPLNIG